jgi:hypothetical protein
MLIHTSTCFKILTLQVKSKKGKTNKKINVIYVISKDYKRNLNNTDIVSFSYLNPLYLVSYAQAEL